MYKQETIILFASYNHKTGYICSNMLVYKYEQVHKHSENMADKIDTQRHTASLRNGKSCSPTKILEYTNKIFLRMCVLNTYIIKQKVSCCCCWFA